MLSVLVLVSPIILFFGLDLFSCLAYFFFLEAPFFFLCLPLFPPPPPPESSLPAPKVFCARRNTTHANNSNHPVVTIHSFRHHRKNWVAERATQTEHAGQCIEETEERRSEVRTLADVGAEGVALTDGAAGFANSLPEPLPLENMRAQELSYCCRRCRLPRTVAAGRTQPTRVSASEPHTTAHIHQRANVASCWPAHQGGGAASAEGEGVAGQVWPRTGIGL